MGGVGKSPCTHEGCAMPAVGPRDKDVVPVHCCRRCGLLTQVHEHLSAVSTLHSPLPASDDCARQLAAALLPLRSSRHKGDADVFFLPSRICVRFAVSTSATHREPYPPPLDCLAAARAIIYYTTDEHAARQKTSCCSCDRCIATLS